VSVHVIPRPHTEVDVILPHQLEKGTGASYTDENSPV